MAANLVKCQECSHEAAVLISHIQQKHNLTLESYYDKHKAAASGDFMSLFVSDIGRKELQERLPVELRQATRPRKTVKLLDLFPMFKGMADFDFDDDAELEVFARPGPLTPKLNPRYHFPPRQTIDLINILMKPERNRVWIQGWSGTGKTDLVLNLAAKLNVEVINVNGDSFMQRTHLVGSPGAKRGETHFNYGPLPRAMRNGYWLLIDEYETLNPFAVNIFKPIAGDPPKLEIVETGEVIYGHPDFRLIATANTWGRGDRTGQFSANVHTQSVADLRRWNAKIKVDYMSPEHEKQVLLNYLPAKTKRDHAVLDKAIEFANKVRKAFIEGTLDVTLSTAEVIAWLENMLALDRSVHYAARVTFLNAYEDDNAKAVLEMLHAIFGAEPEDSGSDSDDLPTEPPSDETAS